MFPSNMLLEFNLTVPNKRSIVVEGCGFYSKAMLMNIFALKCGAYSSKYGNE